MAAVCVQTAFMQLSSRGALLSPGSQKGQSLESVQSLTFCRRTGYDSSLALPGRARRVQVGTSRRSLSGSSRRLSVSASASQNPSLAPSHTREDSSSDLEAPSISAQLSIAAAAMTYAAMHTFSHSLSLALKAILAPVLISRQQFLGQVAQASVKAAGPLFFAAVRSNTINTPLTVIASGIGKWLELYSAVLLIRVLLSWFPNINWERQPLQAIRDMCDPYLNLFRNLLPPVLGALDLSPILAFLVIGFLQQVLSAATA